MSVWERLLGLVAAAAYALRRNKMGFVRMQVGVVLLITPTVPGRWTCV